MKRILALDGGGIRGVFSLEILVRMEKLLRDHLGKPDYRLADHFDFFAGTSTGAIITTFLAWGESAENLRRLYVERSGDMFVRAPFREWVAGRYRSQGLADFLQSYFVENDKTPALFGTAKLRKSLLVVLRNASKGSAWPLTNNPQAKYGKNPRLPDGSLNPDCNLNIPLWQIVRGSTAAPSFYPPETIQIGEGRKFQFVDGGITPYNNPALIAFLTATLPCYCMEWETGVASLRLVSVGTGRVRTAINPRVRTRIPLLRHLLAVPAGLMETVALEQDMLCRLWGACEFGEAIDSEVGALPANEASCPGEKKFAYVRYNKFFDHGEIRQARKTCGCSFEMDQLKLIPFLQEAGAAYAAENVKLEHLL